MGQKSITFFGSLTSLILFLALLTALSLREDYDGDEGFTLRRIEASWNQLYYPFAVCPQGPVDPFDRHYVYDFNPPLYFALIRLICGSNPGRLAVRLFSALPLVLALLWLVLWARRSMGDWGARVIVPLGATTPALVYYGHEARPYALPLAVSCLLVWLLPRLWRRPVLIFGVMLVGGAAGCLMHFAFAWWLIALALLFRGHSYFPADVAERKAVAAGLLGLLGGALVALAVIYPQRQIFKLVGQAVSRPLSPELLLLALAQPFCLIGPHAIPLPVGAGLQIFLMVFALALLPGSGRRRLGLAVLALWQIPLLLPLLAKLLLPVNYYERYSFFALAGWLMTLAWTAQESFVRAGWTRRVGVLFFAAVLLANLAWCARNLSNLRPRWQPVIETIRQQARSGDGYTIDPDWLNFCFAANASVPPTAAYFNGRFGLPSGGPNLWIIVDGPLDTVLRRRIENAGWKIFVHSIHGNLTLLRSSSL